MTGSQQVQKFLSRLQEQTGHRPEQTANGWQSRCPSHDDRKASLSIAEGQGGRVLVDCKAGCKPDSVCQALGMRLADLMPTRHHNGKRKIASAYNYTDEQGQLLFQVVRFEPKDFRQRRPDGGGWSWSIKGVRQVPYRLQDLHATTRPIVIVEGEKDVDGLVGIGVAGATCNAGGAGKWTSVHAGALPIGRPWVIIQDNDDPGRKHAQDVAKTAIGRASEVHIVDLAKYWPDIPPKGDVSDWIDHQRRAGLEGAAIKAELLEIVRKTPVWVPDAAKIAAVAADAVQVKESPAITYLPVPVGATVEARDRVPYNFGDVVADNGESCDVHFRNPTDGNEYTKEIAKTELFLNGMPLVSGGDAGERSFRINIVTSHDLATGDFQAEYFVENVVPVAQPNGLFAPQKSLKTTIKVDLLISLAIGPGALFLGRFPVLRQARCLDLNGESGMGSTQEIAKRICASKGVALESLDHLLWSENLPRFDNPLHLTELDRVIRSEGVEFVPFDCAYLAMPGDNAGNVFAQGELLRDISILCREAGATLMLLHHTKKASVSYEPPELSDASWSGFAEFVRSWILLARREKYVPGTGEHKLWVSIGGSLGHQSLSALDVQEGLRTDPNGRRWDVVLQNADEARTEAKQVAERRRAEQVGQRQADDCRRMLEALRRCPPEGETLTALRSLAGLSGARAADAIRALVGEQRAEQVEIAKYKRNEIGYRETGK